MAQKIAREERRELGLDLFTAYDPYLHAERWGIPVLGISHIGCGQQAYEHFTEAGADRFSASLIPDGTGRVIVENDAHRRPRRRSTVAHEMGHVLLEHEGNVLLSLGNECRSAASPILELEASELAGELLVPTESAHRAALRNWTDDQVAETFEVSLTLATWRMNASGARIRADRARRRRAR
ncbi:putative Zn peptidase (plasmid) [Mycolicibacterium chubuense NBB4]|uniref:Putative Zn peptidase n=2 Tax=Mycolicibacterium chubuense TaxID=1800 RepID=I4BTJ0_MYCCN|nr:putative Zn peptidase [Mycolicibacterium chubuense NBB4]